MKTLTEIRKMVQDLDDECSLSGPAACSDIQDLLKITSAILDRLEQVENVADNAQQGVRDLGGSMAERGHHP